MRKENNEKKPFIWILDKWYEKTAFIIGYAVGIFWILAFVYGFMQGIME